MQGLELGVFGTILYLVMVAIWSGTLAYFVVFRAVPAMRRQTKGHVAPAGHRGAHHAPVAAHGAGHGSHGGHHAAPPPPPPPPKPFRGYSSYEGFKSFASGNTLTIDDIVKGLARESGATAIHEEEHHAPHPEKPVHTGPIDHADRALQVRTNELLRALVEGERDTVFEIIRDAEEYGEGAEPFLTRILTATESALNARLHGSTCDLEVIEIFGSCDTPVLEKLFRALTNAQGKTGARLALTRALSALKSSR